MDTKKYWGLFVVVVLFALVGCAGGRYWTTPQVNQIPSARSDSAMVYDSNREVVVMFGGMENQTFQPLNDMWEWDGSNWSNVSYSSPPFGAFWSCDGI